MASAAMAVGDMAMVETIADAAGDWAISCAEVAMMVNLSAPSLDRRSVLYYASATANASALLAGAEDGLILPPCLSQLTGIPRGGKYRDARDFATAVLTSFPSAARRLVDAVGGDFPPFIRKLALDMAQTGSLRSFIPAIAGELAAGGEPPWAMCRELLGGRLWAHLGGAGGGCGLLDGLPHDLLIEIFTQLGSPSDLSRSVIGELIRTRDCEALRRMCGPDPESHRYWDPLHEARELIGRDIAEALVVGDADAAEEIGAAFAGIGGKELMTATCVALDSLLSKQGRRIRSFQLLMVMWDAGVGSTNTVWWSHALPVRDEPPGPYIARQLRRLFPDGRGA
jgi:hypothetical protein